MRSLIPKRCAGQLGLRGCRRLAPASILRPLRHKAVTTKALYHNPGPRESILAKSAQQALQRVLELVQRGDRDALVDYFATSNLTDTPSLNDARGGEVMVFEDVLERMLLLSPGHHFLDSYAIRHLIQSSPASTQVLSGLMLGPNKYVQRMAVTSALGESCILTFTMTATNPPVSPLDSQSQPQPELESEPKAEAVSDATASGSGAAEPQAATEAGVPVWRLRSVRGEPQYGMGAVQPMGPSPELSPEQIVEAQLAALQRKDLSAAFQFLSPGAQVIVGGEHKFASNMAKHKRFSSLLGHIAATSVRRNMARPNTYMEIVSVTSISGTRFVFLFILSQETSGPEAGCWSIDCVKIIEDPRMIAAVETSFAAQRRAAKLAEDE